MWARGAESMVSKTVFVPVKPQSRLRLASEFREARSFDGVLLIPAIKKNGKVYFCVHNTVYSAPLREDDSIELSMMREDYDVEVEKKLRCGWWNVLRHCVLPAAVTVYFDQQVKRVEDYDALVAIPVVEYEGSLLFCLGNRLHGVPLNADGTASFQELYTVEEAGVEEEKVATFAQIARKLGCKL